MFPSKKQGLQKLGLIGALLQANSKHRVFVKLYIRNGEYLPEYCNYFVIPLRLEESMYGMNNSERMFVDDLTNWLIDESVLKNPLCKIVINYKYAPDVSKLVSLSYVDYCVYWYTYKELLK